MSGAVKARKKQKKNESLQDIMEREHRRLLDDDLLNIIDENNKGREITDPMFMPAHALVNLQMLRELRRIGRDAG